MYCVFTYINSDRALSEEVINVSSCVYQKYSNEEHEIILDIIFGDKIEKISYVEYVPFRDKVEETLSRFIINFQIPESIMDKENKEMYGKGEKHKDLLIRIMTDSIDDCMS